MIPYGKHDLSADDINAVIEVLNSDFLTQGDKVELFQETICKFVGAQYAVATNSATSALHVACLALGIGRGDVVWTSPITFVATSNSVLYCGAAIDFVDIESSSANLCPIKLEEKLKQVQSEGGQMPKAVIAVHLRGMSCNMKAIKKLSDLYGFKIIEDGSHAIGGSYCNNPIGSCQYSDITVFSFHPVKIITTGEGGVAVTNNQKLFDSMKMLSSHGIVKDKKKFISSVEGPWHYEQQALGFNYRLTDIQAGLGISQLKRLKEFVSRRKEISDRYQELLKDAPITSLATDNGQYSSSHHLYVVRVNEISSQTEHAEIFSKMHKKGVMVGLHYMPVYKQPYYQQFNFLADNFPNAEQYYREAVSLPIYYRLTDSEQDYVCSALLEAIYK